MTNTPADTLHFIEQTRQDAEAARKESHKTILSLINSLNRQLIHDERIEDLIRSATDDTYQQQLLAEYGLIPPAP